MAIFHSTGVTFVVIKHFIHLNFIFMKTWKLLLMLFALTFTGVAFTGCSDDEDEAAQQTQTTGLVGKWRQTNNSGTVITLTFNANRTGSCHYKYPNGNSETENFEYQYLPSDLYLRVIGNCQLESDYDVTITATKLRLGFYDYEYGSNNYYEFTRVQ